MMTDFEVRSALGELEEYEQTLKWFRSNLEILKKKFKDQFVVIKDNNVEFATPNIDEIGTLAQSRNIDLSTCLVEFLSEKETVYII